MSAARLSFYLLFIQWRISFLLQPSDTHREYEAIDRIIEQEDKEN